MDHVADDGARLHVEAFARKSVFLAFDIASPSKIKDGIRGSGVLGGVHG